MRRFARIFSVTLITAGLVILVDAGLTIAWKEPLSSVYAQFKQNAATGQLDQIRTDFLGNKEVLDLGPTKDVDKRARDLADLYERKLVDGKPFGEIKIPAIGVDFVVFQGTDEGDLAKGPGHYPTTALPGQGKTIGIAGHRTTYLAPFNKIDSIDVGDEITLEMPYADFTYKVTSTKIVDPTDVQIVDDVGRERLVLTACHPLYSAAQRYAVFADLEDVNLFPGRLRGLEGALSPQGPRSGAPLPEVPERHPQALLKLHARAPAHLGGGGGGIERDPLDLSGAGRGELRVSRNVGDGGEALQQIEDARLATGPDVEGAGSRPGIGVEQVARREKGLDGVGDVDVVAGLQAVAEDRRRLAVEQLAAEDRDDSRLPVRILPGPVDVAEAQGDPRHAVQPAIEADVALGAELARPVRRVWDRGIGLGERQGTPLPLAVHDPTGRGQHARAATRDPRGLEHVGGADDVDQRVEARIGDGTAHVGLSGKVEDLLRLEGSDGLLEEWARR